jgi:hypothetical protein
MKQIIASVLQDKKGRTGTDDLSRIGYQDTMHSETPLLRDICNPRKKSRKNFKMPEKGTDLSRPEVF